MASAHARVVGALAGVALCGLLSRMAEAAPAVRLVYSRAADADSCPDEEALRRAVAARVGYDSFFPWAKRTIVATVTRADGAFAASVDLIDENGIRHGGHQLRTEGACGELLDAVALAVAIAIDPQLLLAQPTIPPPPTPPIAPTLPPVLVPKAPEPAPDPPPPHHDPVTFEGSLGGAAGLAFAPKPSFGGTLGAAVRWRRFSMGLEGFVAAPLSHAANPSGSTYSSWPTLVSIVPCLTFGRLFGCAVVQTGALHSAGDVASGTVFTSSTWWMAAGGRFGALVPVSDRVSLRFRVDVLADLSPPILQFTGQLSSTQPWTAPPVAGSLGIDAVVRFW